MKKLQGDPKIKYIFKEGGNATNIFMHNYIAQMGKISKEKLGSNKKLAKKSIFLKF